MSERLSPPDDELDDDPALAVDPDDELDDDPVEYFVEVVEVSVRVTSVPNSVHSSQTSSSAPSIFTRLGEAISVPHISHWTDSLPVMFSP